MKHISTFSKYNNIKLTRCQHHWVHFSDGTFKSFWTNAHTTKHMSTFSKYNNIKLTRCRHHWVHFSDGTFNWSTISHHLIHSSKCNFCHFLLSLGFVFVQKIQKELQEENEMFLRQVSTSVFYRLQITVHLFTNLRIDPIQTLNSCRLEIDSTKMYDRMEEIMPEPGIFEEVWLSVEAIFMQMTRIVIEYFLRHLLFEFQKWAKRHPLGLLPHQSSGTRMNAHGLGRTTA